MADILITDHGLDFTGETLEEKPLGGAEKALVALAEGLVERGHKVQVFNSCQTPLDHKGVQWRKLSSTLPDQCDVYIANRSNQLISLVPKAKRAFFWIHNPATYLLKWRYLYPLWKRKPDILFSGQYHMSTYPNWAPSGRRISIPLIVDDLFQPKANAEIPERKAVFTSNPMRGLDWLIDLWVHQIHPRLPDAKLHIFSGKEVYGKAGDKLATKIHGILDRAKAAEQQGVILRGPLPQSQLLTELQDARVMPYRGDLSETFCFALAEAQAVAVPCVVQNIGCVSERIVDGKTGFVVSTDEEFANRLLALLSDDDLWLQQHRSCIALRSSSSRNATLDQYCIALGLK